MILDQDLESIITHLLNEGKSEIEIAEIITKLQMPAQAPITGMSSLDRIVRVLDKINDKIPAYINSVKYWDGGQVADLLSANGNGDNNILSTVAQTNGIKNLIVNDGQNASAHLSEMDGSSNAKTLATVGYVNGWGGATLGNYLPIPELAKRKYKRADGSVIGFTDINDSGLPQVTAVTQDYVDAKAPNKQLVVVFNDGSSKSFKVG